MLRALIVAKEIVDFSSSNIIKHMRTHLFMIVTISSHYGETIDGTSRALRYHNNCLVTVLM